MLLASSDYLKFWEQGSARRALKQPLLKLLPGGLLSVKTNIAGEVQIRLAANIASLHRHQRPEMVAGAAKPAASTLVCSRISQTNPETGELVGKTRARKFSRPAAHMIREACGAMEKTYDKKIWFMTLTLPGGHVTAIETMAMYDKEIKNAFLQNFRKVFSRVCVLPGETLDYCIVSELQERGAIHFHIAVGWTNERFARLLKRCYRRWWYKILLHYSRISGVDLSANEKGRPQWEYYTQWLLECEQVEKSVRNYMAKYISKAKSKDALPGINTPSRWWSVSKPLRHKLESERACDAVLFAKYEDAKALADKAKDVLVREGYEVKEIVSRWCSQFLGYIIFAPEGKRQNIFTHARLLCTASGATHWDEGLYDWIEPELERSVE